MPRSETRREDSLGTSRKGVPWPGPPYKDRVARYHNQSSDIKAVFSDTVRVASGYNMTLARVTRRQRFYVRLGVLLTLPIG